MAQYGKNSPWSQTPINEHYLDVFRIRPVSSEADDALYTLETQYTYRPDLLAFDMYGDDKLWWVFIQRNMDVLQDPIYDFVAGTTIYLPKKESLFKVLGI